MPSLTTSLQHSPGHSNNTRERKGIQIGREEVKFSLYADDIVLYIENSKDSIKKLELINKFRKVAGYKINIQKSVSFVYIYNEISKKECKQFLLKSHQKIKYLGVNLTK